MVLLPAYGRDYSSKAKVLADFDTDKDFIARDWPSSDTYINKSQIEKGKVVTFHYASQRKCFVHTVQ